jgi:hypothetical protein
MRLRRYTLPLAALSVFLVSGAPSFGQTTSKGNMSTATQAQPVEISQVPQLALDAGKKALGTTPTDAKVIVGTSPQEYELMAKSKSGKERTVHVLADGTVMKHGKPEREASASKPMPRH